MNLFAHLTHGDFVLVGCAFAAGVVTGSVLTWVLVAKARLHRKEKGE